MVSTDEDYDRLQSTNLKKLASFFKMRYPWRCSFNWCRVVVSIDQSTSIVNRYQPPYARHGKIPYISYYEYCLFEYSPRSWYCRSIRIYRTWLTLQKHWQGNLLFINFSRKANICNKLDTTIPDKSRWDTSRGSRKPSPHNNAGKQRTFVNKKKKKNDFQHCKWGEGRMLCSVPTLLFGIVIYNW